MKDETASSRSSGENTVGRAHSVESPGVGLEREGKIQRGPMDNHRITTDALRFDASLDLALLGFLLVGSVFVARTLRPDIPWIWPLLSGLGGVLCVLFAVIGRPGSRQARRSARLTLGATAGLLLTQTALYWNPPETVHPGAPRLLMLWIVLTIFCLGTMRNAVREGKEAQ